MLFNLFFCDCYGCNINENARKIVEAGSFTVAGCVFISISSIGAGGCLYCRDTSTTLRIETTMFFNISSNNFGGCIYFLSSLSSNVLLSYICSSQSSASCYSFALLCTHSSGINSIIHSSISAISIGSESLTLISGSQIVKNINISKCVTPTVSTLQVSNPSSMESLFITIFRTRATNSKIISFGHGKGPITISYVNFISNNQSSNSYGLISLIKGDYSFIQAIFNENNGLLFYVEKIADTYLRILNSKIGHQSGFISTGSVIFSAAPLTATGVVLPTHNFTHYSSFYCQTQELPLYKPTHMHTDRKWVCFVMYSIILTGCYHQDFAC